MIQVEYISIIYDINFLKDKQILLNKGLINQTRKLERKGYKNSTLL